MRAIRTKINLQHGYYLRPLRWLLICSLLSFCAEAYTGHYSIGVSIQKADQKCALIVWSVFSHSPAAMAGIRAGDEIISLDGEDTKLLTVTQASTIIRSTQADEVRLTLRRKTGQQYSRQLKRVPLEEILEVNGFKDVSGVIVPIDTTEAEVKNMLGFDGNRIAERIFPLHYPTNVTASYPGFEILILRDPEALMAGGIEASAASRAGIHWGDLLVQVNGVSLGGKTKQEVEALFLRATPVKVHLLIDRLGLRKTVTFDLERVSKVLKDNHRQIVRNSLVPDELSEQDLPCVRK